MNREAVLKVVVELRECAGDGDVRWAVSEAKLKVFADELEAACRCDAAIQPWQHQIIRDWAAKHADWWPSVGQTADLFSALFDSASETRTSEGHDTRNAEPDAAAGTAGNPEPVRPAAVAIPKDWQLVPVEPTPEMVEAMHNADPGEPDDEYHGEPAYTARSMWKAVYKAMLAAAPKVEP